MPFKSRSQQAAVMIRLRELGLLDEYQKKSKSTRPADKRAAARMRADIRTRLARDKQKRDAEAQPPKPDDEKWETRKKEQRSLMFQKELDKGSWNATRTGSDTRYDQPGSNKTIVIDRMGKDRCTVYVDEGSRRIFKSNDNLTEEEAQKIALNHISAINMGLE